MKALKCAHCGQIPFESIESILGEDFYVVVCRKCKFGIQVPIEKQKSGALSDTFTHMAEVSKQREKAIAKWNELKGKSETDSLVEKLALVITPTVIEVYDTDSPDELAEAVVRISRAVVEKLNAEPKTKEKRMSLIDMMDSIISNPVNAGKLASAAKAVSDELKKQNEKEQKPLPKAVAEHLETYEIPISLRDKLALKIDIAFKAMKGPEDHFAIAIQLADEIVKVFEKPKTKEPMPCPHCGSIPTTEVVANEYRLQCTKCNVRVEVPMDLSKAIKLATSPDPKERSKAWDATFPLATDAYKELVEKWNNLWK
jgi:transcription elongation factor Elf1